MMTINAQPIHQGKVRATFRLSEELLLLVATDRISTHNIVHKNTIPDKGRVLTALTVFWLTEIFPQIGISPEQHHIVAHGSDILEYLPKGFTSNLEDLLQRSLVVKKLQMLPVELIYRAYLTGSLYKDYYSKGIPDPYGLNLPPELPLMARFTPPVFTPTDKSDVDDPIDSFTAIHRYLLAHELGHQLFHGVRSHLNSVGIELIDAKLEMGKEENGPNPIIADEVFTPDSSRFCDVDDIQEGREPKWLDKQVARDYAEKVWNSGTRIPLRFPDNVVVQLTNTYNVLFRRITGRTLEDFQAY